MDRSSDLLLRLREMRQQRDVSSADLLLLRYKAWSRHSYLKRLGRLESEEAVELRSHLSHIAPLLKRAHTGLARAQDEDTASLIAAARRVRSRNQAMQRIVQGSTLESQVFFQDNSQVLRFHQQPENLT